MKKTLLLGALWLLVAGCAAPVISPTPVSEVQMDKATADCFTCLSYETRRLENHLLQAQVQVRNRDSRPRTLRYRAEWYSETGERLGEGNWDLKIAQASEVFFVTAIAHDPSATMIRIYLK